MATLISNRPANRRILFKVKMLHWTWSSNFLLKMLSIGSKWALKYIWRSLDLYMCVSKFNNEVLINGLSKPGCKNTSVLQLFFFSVGLSKCCCVHRLLRHWLWKLGVHALDVEFARCCMLLLCYDKQSVEWRWNVLYTKLGIQNYVSRSDIKTSG